MLFLNSVMLKNSDRLNAIRNTERSRQSLYTTMYFRFTMDSRWINMEISLTKLSPNGQVVIPSEIRKEAGLAPSTKFLVFNEGGNILLKQIRTETLRKDMKLIEKIQMTEEQIAKGKFIKANTDMSDEEIDDLLIS